MGGLATHPFESDPVPHYIAHYIVTPMWTSDVSAEPALIGAAGHVVILERAVRALAARAGMTTWRLDAASTSGRRAMGAPPLSLRGGLGLRPSSPRVRGLGRPTPPCARRGGNSDAVRDRRSAQRAARRGRRPLTAFAACRVGPLSVLRAWPSRRIDCGWDAFVNPVGASRAPVGARLRPRLGGVEDLGAACSVAGLRTAPALLRLAAAATSADGLRHRIGLSGAAQSLRGSGVR